MQLTWDIFCRVIDNYGDIGVCWRLARQLASEHGKQLRLWVDDLNALIPLCPAVAAKASRQLVQGIEICRWTDEVIITETADVVIEAFACELPASYLQAMAARSRPPVWLNLEYLTAETWADGCHGMASPHPRLPLTKHFVFPGFSVQTAGLLRERDLFARRDAWQLTADSGSPPPQITLFCYDHAPVAAWLDALRHQAEALHCLAAPGKPLAAVRAALGHGAGWSCGPTRIETFDFLPMDEYDQLLWSSQINFVRGEDSFIRAQWAARPFVWHIYPQEDGAHLLKLAAFLDRYCAAMPPQLAAIVRRLFVAWNTDNPSRAELAPAWTDFFAQRHAIAEYNRDWAAHLAVAPDLATSLVKFSADRV